MSEKGTDYCFDFTDLRKILEDIFESKGKQEEKQEDAPKACSSKADEANVTCTLRDLANYVKKLEEKIEDLAERMRIQEAAEDVDIEELNDLKERVSTLEEDRGCCNDEGCGCCDDDCSDEEDLTERKVPITISVVVNR